jgi:hypothetical protein
MNTTGHYDWRRFSVFAGANLAAVGILASVAIMPIIDQLQDQRQRIDQATAGLDRMTSLIERKGDIEARSRTAAVWLSKPFLHGETLNGLSTELLARLRHLADQHRIVFNSLASQPARSAGGFHFVGARVEFAASSAQASRILAAMESELPFLYLHAVKLSAVQPSASGEEMVAVTLEVYGATRWRKS